MDLLFDISFQSKSKHQNGLVAQPTDDFVQMCRPSKIKIHFFLKGTASEATLVALLSAKAKAVDKFKQQNENANVSEFKAKLVAYASCQAHSSVERAGLLGDVKMRLLEPDEDLSLRGKTLAKVRLLDY